MSSSRAPIRNLPIFGFGAAGLYMLVAAGAMVNTACPADTDGSSTPTPCAGVAIAANGLFPGDGERFAYIGNPVIVSFTNPVAAAAAFVLFQGDTEVAGAALLSEDRRQLVFTPTDRLSPGTEYSATVTATAADDCNGIDVSWTFNTSDAGTPMDDPNTIVGSTYSLDLGSALFLEPAGVGPLLAQVLNFPLFSDITSLTDGTDIVMHGSAGAEGAAEQDYCLPTAEFPPATLSNPDFSFGPDNVDLQMEDMAVTIDDMYLDGTFTRDGAEIVGATLRGLLDTRGVESLFEGQGDPCALLFAFTGIGCEACPGDDVVACLRISAINISGERLDTSGWAAGDWVNIAQDQAENRLCSGTCDDGLDNDGDDTIDAAEAECLPTWPGGLN